MFEVQTRWIITMTQAYCGFVSLLQGCKCFADVMDGLTEVSDRLDRLSEAELKHEFKDMDAAALLRERISNGDKLPDSPVTYNTNFCTPVQKPFGIWLRVADTMRLKKAERKFVKGLVERITAEYLKKVEAFKRITGIAAALRYVPEGEYDWNKPVEGDVLLKPGTPYEAMYEKMKEWNALPDGLPAHRFVYYVSRGYLEDMARWARKSSKFVDVHYLAKYAATYADGDVNRLLFRSRACEGMGIPNKAFANTNDTRRILQKRTFD